MDCLLNFIKLMTGNLENPDKKLDKNIIKISETSIMYSLATVF